MSNENNEEYLEYETFMTTTKAGDEVEMAIVDRFEFEGKQYVVAALIKDDEISDDGLFVYQETKEGDETVIDKIADPDEYSKVAEYYAEKE
ncbi:MAG: DUF1292 domain-containing protein [Lachnospiraceae bacterium]|nr:DUF1292 domain-containing protein [Lachnospiraceae bacterium]